MPLLTPNNNAPANQCLILLVEYLGSAFSGAQRQANAYSVQQAMEEALDKLGIIHGAVTLSGRTDAGVHARGQVMNVTVPNDALTNIPDVIAALNAVLLDAMSVKDYAIASDLTFHARKKAQWRWYRYALYNQPYRSVWMPPDAFWLRQPLDIDAMKQASQYFLGTHDFESFKCPNTEVTNNVCTVIQSEIQELDGLVVYDIVANRFLYKMVRNLVGTLIEIGLHAAFESHDMPAILAAHDRKKAGPAANSGGLSLMAVYYPSPWGFFKNDVYVKKLKHVVSTSQESSPHEENLHRQTA